MARIYSTYEAKAKLSEILRAVRDGHRVGISYHGQLIAEVTPLPAAPEAFEKRLRRLEAEGVVTPPRRPGASLPRFGRRPGALKRFIKTRD
jgi:prevent-host-death family protein